MIYSWCVLHVGHCNQYRSVEVGSGCVSCVVRPTVFKLRPDSCVSVVFDLRTILPKATCQGDLTYRLGITLVAANLLHQ